MKYELKRNVVCQAKGCNHFNKDKRVSQGCLLISMPYDPMHEPAPVRIGKNGQCISYSASE